ncbi:hypothetical protein ACLESD_10040, partial [Pyxidicoccus sp. 3LFB2]
AAGKAAEAAAAASDLRKRQELYASALAKLRACQDDGARMVKENASLASIEVLVGGSPTRPQEAMAQCAQQTEALKEPQRRADLQLGFHEGPKKAYDSAKALISKGRKNEALPQLNNCIADGRILENRYPDLKEQKFETGSARMSLLELIQACVKERKALQSAP